MFAALIPSLLSSGAEILAKAIGTSQENKVVKIVQDTLGTIDNTPEALKTALGLITPEQQLALKKANNDFILAEKNIDLQKIQAEEQTVQSAQTMAIQMADKDPELVKPVNLFAYVSVLLLVIMVIGLFIHGVFSDGERDMVILMIFSFIKANEKFRLGNTGDKD
ncbi:MAG: hypothetical protein M1308_14045 [Actinobacteria bacterium]|nr:hypothetical protein [Actinomycetota bacterium]